MNRNVTVAAIVAVVAVVAVAVSLDVGYRLGTQSARESVDTAAVAKSGRKLLYYRNPMGLPDTSPVPKKDPMGMDYIPVYEGEGQAAGEPGASNVVALSTEKVQKLGVTTTAVERVALAPTVRAVGRVEIDERRQYTVAPKFEGWIERLYVNTTGQRVARGEPLFDVYAPELVSAQREYALAARGLHATGEADRETHASMQRLADAALSRLRNWDIGEADLQRLAAGDEPTRTLTFRASAPGVVIEKQAIQGMRFGAGDVLYRIADLSTVWVIADVFEQELALISVGQTADIRVTAYPGREFKGRVSYIYPTLKQETRTVQVRLELPNSAGLLKPAMYAEVQLDAATAGKAKVLAVPTTAVLQTGTRDLVLVELGEGRFEPREVRLGLRTDTLLEVREGLKEGERVVTSANFLIDAESNLRAALANFGGARREGPSPTTAGAAANGTVIYRGEGSVEAVNPVESTVSLAHGPIPALKWPAMTMDFRVKDPALLRTLKPGQKIEFELVAEAPGEYVIVRAAPAAAGPAAGAHQGH